eukprot:scaffold2042_cov80-Skeletonema_dohrnii-CCMP3373.AAC.2
MTVDRMIAGEIIIARRRMEVGGRAEQAASDKRMAADLLDSDDLRNNRGEAMMYVTVVIFYEGCCCADEKEGNLFGVEFKPPRFSLSHGVSKRSHPLVLLTMDIVYPLLIFLIKESN